MRDHEIHLADVVAARPNQSWKISAMPLDQLLVGAHHAVQPPQVVVRVLVLGLERIAVGARLGTDEVAAAARGA